MASEENLKISISINDPEESRVMCKQKLKIGDQAVKIEFGDWTLDEFGGTGFQLMFERKELPALYAHTNCVVHKWHYNL